MFSNCSDLYHTFSLVLPFWAILFFAFVPPLFFWLVVKEVLKRLLHSNIGLYVQRRKKCGLCNSDAVEQLLGCYE